MLKKLAVKRTGFTLIEMMMTIGILGIVTTGLGVMLKNSFYAWNFGGAGMKLNAEARTAMIAMTKIIQNAQVPSVKVTRLNSSEPANSYLSGKIGETVYVTLGSAANCGFAGGGSNLAGTAGADFAIYQNGRALMLMVPSIPPGANLSDPSTISVSYQHLTLTTSLDSFMVTFNDTDLEKSVSVGVKLSKLVYKDRDPVNIFLKKVVVLKHHHSSGYYGN